MRFSGDERACTRVSTAGRRRASTNTLGAPGFLTRGFADKFQGGRKFQFYFHRPSETRPPIRQRTRPTKQFITKSDDSLYNTNNANSTTVVGLLINESKIKFERASAFAARGRQFCRRIFRSGRRIRRFQFRANKSSAFIEKVIRVINHRGAELGAEFL